MQQERYFVPGPFLLQGLHFLNHLLSSPSQFHQADPPHSQLSQMI